MTVSRTITVTYDAPDELTAAWVEDFVERIVSGQRWGTFEDVADAKRFLPTLTNQAFSAEPTRPVDPAWVAGDGMVLSGTDAEAVADDLNAEPRVVPGLADLIDKTKARYG